MRNPGVDDRKNIAINHVAGIDTAAATGKVQRGQRERRMGGEGDFIVRL